MQSEENGSQNFEKTNLYKRVFDSLEHIALSKIIQPKSFKKKTKLIQRKFKTWERMHVWLGASKPRLVFAYGTGREQCCKRNMDERGCSTVVRRNEGWEK